MLSSSQLDFYDFVAKRLDSSIDFSLMTDCIGYSLSPTVLIKVAYLSTFQVLEYLYLSINFWYLWHHGKFHPHRCGVSPLWREKLQNRPLRNLNTGALRCAECCR